MTKQLKLHSRVGIITNSSTELFVISKPVENIEELLQAMIDLENKINKTSLQYDDVFKSLVLYTKEKFKDDARDSVEAIKRYEERCGRKPEHSYDWGYEKEENVGATMLYGACDNTIPYWILELIECSNFGERIERFHLG